MAVRSRPVRVIAVTEPRKLLALVTTDMATPAEQITARSAGRWAMEVAISDAKNITGAGETPTADRPPCSAPYHSPCSPRAS